MNPLQRSIIEKTGNDNGFEHVVASDLSGVTLASARHANLDALFDRFLISFGGGGKLIVSRRLIEGDLQLLGLHLDMQLRWIAPEHDFYLASHRKRVR